MVIFVKMEGEMEWQETEKTILKRLHRLWSMN